MDFWVMKAAISPYPLTNDAWLFSWWPIARSRKSRFQNSVWSLTHTQSWLIPQAALNLHSFCKTAFGQVFLNSDAEENACLLKLWVQEGFSDSPRTQRVNTAQETGPGGRGRIGRFVFCLYNWHWHISFVRQRPGLPYISVKCLAHFGPFELLH